MNPNTMDKLQCDKCGKSLAPTLGGEVIWDRGYWWHLPCAKVFSDDEDQTFVSFPSDGKLCPATILRTLDTNTV
jgi:hypothetical protein